MRHLKVSLIVWAKSQDSVHKPQFLKRKESRSGSNRGPSVYQPSALPLGHTDSRADVNFHRIFISPQEARKALDLCLSLSAVGTSCTTCNVSLDT